MDARAVEAVISKRSNLPRAPTLLARVGRRKVPIAFTHLRGTDARRRQSSDVPREQSFSFQVPLTPFPWHAWFAGEEKVISPATPGNTFLFDLSNNPTVALDTAFDMFRFNIPQSALDMLAEEQELPRVAGLRAPSLGYPDAVMHGLALTLVAAMERPGEVTSLFVEYVALAFHAHVLRAYGDVVAQVPGRRGLARWQLRRACEFMEANLGGDPSIAEIATQCGLSSSHFARAFKEATGAPPHAWLLTRRTERAKQLMNDTHLDLAEIALACGFVDQSHFTRTFVKNTGSTPGRWRRLRLSKSASSARA
jgi:AraC family transcriptional regulator